MADAKIPAARACSKCGETKPLTQDYFATAPTCSGGMRHVCRHCCNARAREARAVWKLSNPELAKARARRQNQRDYALNKERRLARMREKRAEEPELHRARDRHYFRKNRESKRETAKRRWAKADKAAARAKLREWMAANPDKARAMELRRNERIRSDPELREKAAKRVREWARANPGAAAAQRARRRARELGACGEYTRQHVHAILRLQGRKCYYCYNELARFDVDHFIPLSRGGSNDPDNIVVCCDSCNSSKGSKLPWEWRPERFSEGQTPR